MENKSNRSLKASMLSLFIVSILVVITATYAWFAINDSADAGMGMGIEKGLNVDIKFYYFLNENHNGASNSQNTLVNNVTTTNENNKYQFISPPEMQYIIGGGNGRRAIPGDKFSFAISLENTSSSVERINIAFGELKSYLNDKVTIATSPNNIQRAFQYSVTKIVYSNSGVETEIDSPSYITERHFLETIETYPVVTGLELDSVSSNTNHKAIVFLDIMFDPTVYGVDNQNQSTGNSNVFMNQILSIGKISFSKG